MHSQYILLLVVGLLASTYAYHLSDVKKRSVENDPRILNFFQDFYNQVIHPPLNHVVQNLALLSAQLLAGISQTGIPTLGGRTNELSDPKFRGFFDDLWNQVVRPPLENAIQGLSLMGAQALAGIGVNGIDLSSIFGKADLVQNEARFIEALGQAFNQVWESVLQKPLEQALQTTALMAAQVLAGIGTTGINLSTIFGKQDLTVEEARFIDQLGQTFTTLFQSVFQKPLEQALQTTALMAAQVLAGIGTTGVDLSTIFGREDQMRNFFQQLGDGLLSGLQSVWSNVIKDPLEQALQTSALMAAQVLAGIGTTGISLGKREIDAAPRGEIIDGIVSHATGLYQTQLKPAIENALNSALLHLAGVLANFSQSGIGRR